MKQGFLLKAGLNLTIKQLKNRWTQCKTLYTFWKELQTSTALGRRPDGTVIASRAWWEKKLKVNKSFLYCSMFRGVLFFYVLLHFCTVFYVPNHLFVGFRGGLSVGSS